MVLNCISYTSYSESERMKKDAPIRESTNQGETACDKLEIIVSVRTLTRSPRFLQLRVWKMKHAQVSSDLDLFRRVETQC